jgi:CCR4-NOT transcription complex subunit 1
MFITMHEDASTSRVSFLDSVLALVTLVLNHHHVKRGEQLNQRLFFRLLSMLLYEVHNNSENLSETEQREIMLKFAARFNDIGPLRLPGFTFGWLSLIQHRVFLPIVLQMPDNAGWAPCAKLLVQRLVSV